MVSAILFPESSELLTNVSHFPKTLAEAYAIAIAAVIKMSFSIAFTL